MLTLSITVSNIIAQSLIVIEIEYIYIYIKTLFILGMIDDGMIHMSFSFFRLTVYFEYYMICYCSCKFDSV